MGGVRQFAEGSDGLVKERVGSLLSGNSELAEAGRIPVVAYEMPRQRFARLDGFVGGRLDSTKWYSSSLRLAGGLVIDIMQPKGRGSG